MHDGCQTKTDHDTKRVLIRIFVVRCCDNLFVRVLYAKSIIRRASEAEQAA